MGGGMNWGRHPPPRDPSYGQNLSLEAALV